MKLVLVVYSAEAESVWNAFRLGNFALKQRDTVAAFLIGKGVESERHEAPPFNVREQMEAFAAAGGSIRACGTCLTLRQSPGTELCPLSTMQDLHQLIRDADRVVSF